MRYNTEHIKSIVTMPDLAARYGVTVRHGMCCCPFHGERHPSMKIYQDGYHCFACDAHGDVISWVMQFDGVGFSAACERLCEWYGIDVTPTVETPADTRRAELVNEYNAACERVRELQPKKPDEQPSVEFWWAVFERNKLEDLILRKVWTHESSFR